MGKKKRPVEHGAFSTDRETAAHLLCQLAGVRYSRGYALTLAQWTLERQWFLMSIETRRRVLSDLDNAIALAEVLLQ